MFIDFGILGLFFFPFSASGTTGTTKNGPGTTVYPVIICGENSGQHVYLDAGKSSTADMTITNTFDTTTTFARKWLIKVSQIECDSTALPPEPSCYQYFTGTSNIVKSFNFDSTSSTVVRYIFKLKIQFVFRVFLKNN